jgi:hypothetical protein
MHDVKMYMRISFEFFWCIKIQLKYISNKFSICTLEPKHHSRRATATVALSCIASSPSIVQYLSSSWIEDLAGCVLQDQSVHGPPDPGITSRNTVTVGSGRPKAWRASDIDTAPLLYHFDTTKEHYQNQPQCRMHFIGHSRNTLLCRVPR